MAKRKVLVVEDERDIAELLALHLRDLNCEVTLAADGHEGMRQAFARNWGLAIVKRILDLHGSLITVSSTLNQGTRFEFEIPARAA